MVNAVMSGNFTIVHKQLIAAAKKVQLYSEIPWDVDAHTWT